MAEAHVGNWNRWGEEDQLGALNQMTRESVLGAIAAVKHGQVLSLGLNLSATGTPAVPSRPCLVHTMMLDGADFEAGSRRGQGGFQYADDYVAMPVHTGTHIDALSHVARDGKMYNGFPASDVRSHRGARSLGMERFGSLVTRALVLNIPRTLGIDHLPDGHEITIDEIELTLGMSGHRVEPGDAVIIHTGWLARHLSGQAASYETEAGIGESAGLWLAHHDVTLIAADTWAVEAVPSSSGDMMPVHLICLVDHGIYLVELIDTRPLINAMLTECLLVIAPLPIEGGVGSPVNPVVVY